MKKFSYVLDLVGEDVDSDDVVSMLMKALSVGLDSNIQAHIKPAGVKSFSEQGFKVYRARVMGVTAKQAGDAHNGKVEKETVGA